MWGWLPCPPWESSGLMSLTRSVPALVPSDFHSSLPWPPPLAAKYNRPAHRVRRYGSLPDLPFLTSLTWTVPTVLPSDVHSSRPRAPSSALKNKRPLTAVRAPGRLPGASRGLLRPVRLGGHTYE